MLRLADAGWRVPQIARHLGYFVSHAFAQANKGAVGVLRVGHLPENMGQNIDH
jgi:hypothetical protein